MRGAATVYMQFRHFVDLGILWLIGRIYERNGFPDEVRFFWSLHGVVLTRPPSTNTDGAAATLEEAKAQFQKSWDAWMTWAGLKEVP